MNKIILISALVLSLFSCEENSKGYIIKGQIEGVEDGIPVTLKALENGKQVPLDTAYIKNESFSFNGEITNPDLHLVMVRDIIGTLPFILENKELKMTLYKDSLGMSVIEGSKENDFAQDYRKKASEFRFENNALLKKIDLAKQNNDTSSVKTYSDRISTIRQNFRDFNINYAYDNNNSIFSILLLENLFRTRALKINEINDIFKKYSDTLQNSSPGKRIKGIIDIFLATEIGAIAPDFTAPNPDGEEVTMSAIRGKVTIIDFWAAWCGPCRKENPNLVRLYNKYHDKGLEIIGVSLDGSSRQKEPKKAWLDAIEKDGLTWHQVSNLNYFNDPVAKKYNIQSIPAAFILDSDGKIIAKNLRGQALEQKITELLD